MCVFLTQPTDPEATNPEAQLLALQSSKAALLHGGAALTAVIHLLAEPLSRCGTRVRRAASAHA